MSALPLAESSRLVISRPAAVSLSLETVAETSGAVRAPLALIWKPIAPAISGASFETSARLPVSSTPSVSAASATVPLASSPPDFAVKGSTVDGTGGVAADGCHHVHLLRECSTRGLGQQRRQQVGLDSELQRSVGERDVALTRSAQRSTAQSSLVEVDAIPGDCRGRVGFQRSSQQAGNSRVGTAGALGRCRQRHWSGTIGDVETVGMQLRFNAVQFGVGGRDLGEACGRIDRRRIACTEGAQRGLADRGRHRRVALAEGQCRRRAARGKLH